VSDLLGDPIQYVNRPFVATLDTTRRFELAATTSLFAKKPI